MELAPALFFPTSCHVLPGKEVEVASRRRSVPKASLTLLKRRSFLPVRSEHYVANDSDALNVP